MLGHAPLSEKGRFPLLLKYLDAQDTLSIQVHPDVVAARKLPNAAPKTECWYVIDSRDGFILKGVKEGVTALQFRKALEQDDVADLLVRIPVKAGDFHYLPAGTVHALGAGTVVAEIQTPSDTTYRVSDWGRGREIHVEEAMQCIHFEPAKDRPPGSGGDCLLKCEYFHVYLRRPEKGAMTAAAQNRCLAWMFLKGKGSITGIAVEEPLEFSAGDTFVLPADLARTIVEFYEPAIYLEILLPPF